MALSEAATWVALAAVMVLAVLPASASAVSRSSPVTCLDMDGEAGCLASQGMVMSTVPASSLACAWCNATQTCVSLWCEDVSRFGATLAVANFESADSPSRLCPLATLSAEALGQIRANCRTSFYLGVVLLSLICVACVLTLGFCACKSMCGEKRRARARAPALSKHVWAPYQSANSI